MVLRITLLSVLLLSSPLCLNAQQFTRITDPSNPVVTGTGGGAAGYSGAAWVDYDNDGDIDLFACPDRLFRNNGTGGFTEVNGHGIGAGLPHAPATGVSWADMDNDGDIDCLYSGALSVLYRNNGADSGYSFTRITRGEIASLNNRGWAGAWGDFDNDGFVDPLITHPRGFVGSAIRNPFFRNLGGGEFERITAGDVVKDLAPYTVATWYDYDLDGDQDLFIGSGPAGTPARDFLFKNMLKETGTAQLARINDGVLGTDLVDGQVWNWIDFDNDGDLDAYLTNYGGVASNNLYRNDQGVFTKLTAETVGPIVTGNNSALSNIWADFDNDGDVDCYVTRDGQRLSVYYTNNGNGTFTMVDSVPMVKVQAPHIAAVAGDYDGDGDQDLFVISGGGSNELYRNDQPKGNHWFKATVNGAPLNRTAIGAKVKVKATIGGKSYWQIREISSQNSFNGHNEHAAHFGLGNAAVIDSLVVEWLSGKRLIRTAVPVDTHLVISENGEPAFLRSVFYGDVLNDQVPFTVSFTDISVSDPTSQPTSWSWDFNADGHVDATTRHASSMFTTPDTFSVRLIVSGGGRTDTLTRKKYIIARPSAPSISMNTAQHYFGAIDVNTEKKDTTVHVYNYGKAADTLSATLVYGVTSAGTVKPDSALALSPASFILAPGDSQGVTFTFFPRRVIRTNLTITYTPKIVVMSKGNIGAKVFEKNMFFKLSGTLTHRDTDLSLPFAFSLSQNYPNPFNPSTTIDFTIPRWKDGSDRRVVLEIYSLLGEKVATVVDGRLNEGAYSAVWDGSQAASGIYLYRLTAGSSTEIRKLVLLK